MAIDGAVNMVERLFGAVSNISEDCTGDVYRAGCDAHRSVLAVQMVLKENGKESLYFTFTELTSYLQRQKKLVASNEFPCRKAASILWLSFGVVCHWFVTTGSTIKKTIWMTRSLNKLFIALGGSNYTPLTQSY